MVCILFLQCQEERGDIFFAGARSGLSDRNWHYSARQVSTLTVV